MLSHKIILFLSNLPHFQHDNMNGQLVATRLTDGTVFISPEESEASARGLLDVHWQGDSNRKSIVIGTQVAALEIVEAIRHWVTTGELKDEQEAVKHLFQHFQFKTGESLYIPDNDSVLPKSLEPFIKDLGWSAVKKMLGLP